MGVLTRHRVGRSIPAFAVAFAVALAAMFGSVGPAAAAPLLIPGDIIVADPGAFGGAGGVVRMNGTNAPLTLASGAPFLDPTGVAIAPDGDLVVVDAGGGTAGVLYRTDPTTGARTVISELLLHPSAVAVAGNHAWVTDRDLNGGSLLRFDLRSGRKTTIAFGAPFSEPEGVAIAPDGRILVVDAEALGGTGAVFAVDAGTGLRSTVSSGGSFVDPSGIAVGPDGAIFVADRSAFGGAGGVIRIDAGGAHATIASGVPFADPRGIVRLALGDLVVADPSANGGNGALFVVDPYLPGAGVQAVPNTALTDPSALVVSSVFAAKSLLGNGQDRMRLHASGDDLELRINGTLHLSAPLAEVTAVVIAGNAEIDDLVIDAGFPFRIPGGIRFDGAGGSDTLVTIGDGDWVATDDRLRSSTGISVRARNVEASGMFGRGGPNVLDASRRSLPMGLDGGGGDDVLIGGTAPDRLTGGSGNDDLDGGDGADVLGGGPGDDDIDGGQGTDTLREAADADFTLTDSSMTGLGADALVDVDAVDLTSRTAGNTITLAGWTKPGTIRGAGGIDTIRTVGGSATASDTHVTPPGGVTISISGFEQAVLVGSSGVDTLDGSQLGIPLKVDGLGGNDTVLGGRGPDLLLGGAGMDSVTGGEGDDEMDGGLGVDTLIQSIPFGVPDLRLTAAELHGMGIDIVRGFERATLTGNNGINRLDASAFPGAVTLVGLDGNDALVGGTGNDILTGGLGNDAMTGGGGGDRIAETGNFNMTVRDGGLQGIGTDTFSQIEEVHLTGGASNNVIDASLFTSGSVRIDGAAGNDRLTGTGFGDLLIGGPGLDTLRAGDGNDTIQAQDGQQDTVDGGLGTDTAQIDTGLDTVSNVP